MNLIEVVDKEDRKAFHNVVKQLYAKDPFWVCPLEAEIEDIFDPLQNSLFKEGEAIRWVL